MIRQEKLTLEGISPAGPGGGNGLIMFKISHSARNIQKEATGKRKIRIMQHKL